MRDPDAPTVIPGLLVVAALCAAGIVADLCLFALKARIAASLFGH